MRRLPSTRLAYQDNLQTIAAQPQSVAIHCTFVDSVHRQIESCRDTAPKHVPLTYTVADSDGMTGSQVEYLFLKEIEYLESLDVLLEVSGLV